MRAVIDASVAVKWVITEDKTDLALAILGHYRFIAPDLLFAECTNVLWKKVRRGEIAHDLASRALSSLQASGITILPTRGVIGNALDLAVHLDHPAYDCVYLGLATDQDCPCITADRRFLARLERLPPRLMASRVFDLQGAVDAVSHRP